MHKSESDLSSVSQCLREKPKQLNMSITPPWGHCAVKLEECDHEGREEHEDESRRRFQSRDRQ